MTPVLHKTLNGQSNATTVSNSNSSISVLPCRTLKMLSLITNFFSRLLKQETYSEDENFVIDEDKIVTNNKIDEIDNEISENSSASTLRILGQSNPCEQDFKVIKSERKFGKVTYLGDTYGIIDNLLYFEPSQISLSLNLKEGDEVVYTSFKARNNESDRVCKIYALKNDCWENIEEDDKPEEDNEIMALTRVINGRVTKRQGRMVYVEPSNVWCDLDKIEASYVPIEGDWVSLETVTTVDDETIDLSGDILEIKSLKPVLMKSGTGRVTLRSDETEDGVIENFIHFTKIECEEGFFPFLGDKVVYDAIESDQDKYKWRALKVYPFGMSKKKRKPGNNTNKENFFNKNNIEISPTSCLIDIELEKTKTILLKVVNVGDTEQFLKKTNFHSNRKTSQLVLLSPKLFDSFKIKPKETITYKFECEGKFLGLSKEIFVFYFNNFIIAREFEINVTGNKEMDAFLKCDLNTVYKVTQRKRYSKNVTDDTKILRGPKPWRPPKFVSGEKKGHYKVSDKLWAAVVGDPETPKFTLESIKGLEEYAPYLKQDLNLEYYSQRFHTLLFLEEIEIKRVFRNYDMNGVILFRNGEYLVLEVPGLGERRPSIICGDEIIVTQPWCESYKVQHVGYVHEIRQKEIYVKFHSSFHDSYNESECDVIFEPNFNSMSRCHDAINRALKKLGPDWLFPSAVNEKPPQVQFEFLEDFQVNAGKDNTFIKKREIEEIDSSAEDNEEKTENLREMNLRSSVKIKKLIWYNKNLNERQKSAVKNVLKAQGRPLPYIIFGPPGTGKTITLVEAITQIYSLVPDCRILVSTPSNSSADLISERLIECGGFKPGELMRLTAYWRAKEGNIPTKLLPYTTVVDLRDDRKKSTIELSSVSSSNVKTSTLKVIGRHKITVGTCTCLGSLHYVGFPTGHFTHIVVDEAGQASEPEILIAATFLNKHRGQMIMAGDPLQLGPLCTSKLSEKYGLDTSLLQRFVNTFPYTRDFVAFLKTSGYDPRFITRLNINYRSVPEVLSLPNQLFYDSELVATVSQKKGLEADIIKRINIEIENRDDPPAIVFHGIFGQNYQENDSPSWYNPHEIWQVVSYLRRCYNSGLTSSQIGIVTPYNKQAQKLRELITTLALAIPKIGTVEEFQGQERYVIIISTVRSSVDEIDKDFRFKLGFLANPRRLNVALTRGRAVVIIVGNPVLLSNDPYWKNVVNYCVRNNSYTGCNLNNSLNNEDLVED